MANLVCEFLNNPNYKGEKTCYLPQTDNYRLDPADCDLAAYKRLAFMKDHMLEFVRQGKTLFLWSNRTGNGKTTWAKKLQLSFDNKYYDAKMNYYKKTYPNDKYFYINKESMFITLSELFYKKHMNFDDTTLEDNMMKAKLLIIDDIGTKPTGEYDTELLYTIINSRLENGLTTIVTSNCSPAQLEKVYDRRIVSRLTSDIVLEFKGLDRRCIRKEYEYDNPTELIY